jgi:hypothetical protein
MVSVGDFFFLKLGNGKIVGCNHLKQVEFLEHEDIAIDFWDHEYETVLLGDEDSLYEVGKGIAKRFRIIHAQPCLVS